MSEPTAHVRANVRTPEGVELGQQLARLCDAKIDDGPDNRCQTCAFRRGDHLANGSPETLMSAVKCAVEGDPFWCHEHDRACAGWSAMRFHKWMTVKAPWDHVGGGTYKAGDVIPLPYQP